MNGLRPRVRPVGRRLVRLAVVLASVAAALVAATPALAAGATTTTTLTVTPNPAGVGRQITLSAEVSSTSGNPTGQVGFYNGSVLIVEAPLTPLEGSTMSSVAQTTMPLPTGTYAIQAFYDSNSLPNFWNSSSAVTTEQVGDATPLDSTTTTLSTNTARAISSQASVVLTAAVAAAGATTTPTGEVDFFDNGNLLGTARLDADGDAVLTAGGFGAGDNTIQVAYEGDSTDAESSATLTLTVSSAADAPRVTTTALTTDTSRTIGTHQSVTLTALVSVPGSSAVPTGSVTFRDNGLVIGAARLDPTGMATLATGGFTGGGNTIEVGYAGDRSDAPSSTTMNLTVIPSASTTHPTALALSTNTPKTITRHESVTVVAHVSERASSGVPSGRVLFLDNGIVLASALLDKTGTASVATGAFAAGTNRIEAEYGGGPHDDASHAELVLTVTAPAATAKAAAHSQKMKKASSHH